MVGGCTPSKQATLYATIQATHHATITRESIAPGLLKIARALNLPLLHCSTLLSLLRPLLHIAPIAPK
jgi:hypothetical protein